MDTTTATVSSSATAQKSASGKGAAKSGSHDFMDMIQSQLNAQKSVFTKPQAATAATNQNAGQNAAKDDLSDAIDSGDISSLPAELQKLLQELAAQLQPASDAQTAAADADAGAGKNTTLALLSPAAKQKLLAALQSLMNGLPASQRPTIQTLENGILKPLDSTNLVADAAKADTTPDGTSALIVSGLSPQQLTNLMKQIKDGDTTDAASAAGNALASQIALIQLTPPVRKDAVALPAPALKALTPQKADPAALPTPAAKIAADALQAAAVSDDASTDAGTDTGTDQPQMTAMSRLQSASEAAPQKGLGSFEHVLKMFESARVGQGQNGFVPPTALKSDITAGGSAIAAASLAQSGDALAGSLTSGDPLSGLPGLGANGLAMQNIPLTTPAMAAMTDLTTTAPMAIYAHPAAEQLAASIKSEFRDAGKSGLTMRLDPPDLGRISVKMEFRDDKTVKAVISIDKPETFLMMQKESHVLQQALDDAGLKTGQNGLTFELSQDGSAFGQQNRQNGQQNSGKFSRSNDDVPAIETTMDWSVGMDGTRHYNILA